MAQHLFHCAFIIHHRAGCYHQLFPFQIPFRILYKVFLSSNYFGDLVKKETGKTAQEYIQNKIIDLAKEMIIGSGKTVSQIAYELGYQYSQHFNRVFKKNVGYTPSEYRHLQV